MFHTNMCAVFQLLLCYHVGELEGRRQGQGQVLLDFFFPSSSGMHGVQEDAWSARDEDFLSSWSAQKCRGKRIQDAPSARLLGP